MYPFFAHLYTTAAPPTAAVATTAAKTNYVRLEAKGLVSCSLGSKITNSKDCADACSKLGVGPLATLKDGKACYKAGNGKCRQDGRRGSGASLICYV